MKAKITAPPTTLHLIAIACGEVGISTEVRHPAIYFTWDPLKDRALELQFGLLLVTLDAPRGEPRLSVPALIAGIAQARLGLGPAQLSDGRASWTLAKGTSYTGMLSPGLSVELTV